MKTDLKEYHVFDQDIHILSEPSKGSGNNGELVSADLNLGGFARVYLAEDVDRYLEELQKEVIEINEMLKTLTGERLKELADGGLRRCIKA